MSNIEEVTLIADPATDTGAHASYVDWPAIIGGIVVASGISIVLISFGAALGLSFTTVASATEGSVIGMAIGAALWFLWVEVSSFMAGGYLAGRLRRRFGDSTEAESDVRDGMHGLLVWGGAVVVGAWLAMAGVGVLANAASNLAGGAAAAVSTTLPDEALGNGDNYFVDSLLRGGAAGDRAPAGALNAEVGRILLNAGDGEMPAADRDYLVTIVTERANLSPEEAAARVDSVLAAYNTAREEARQAAEAARKVGIISGFLIAASLLISAAGAYWAATVGGKHRDEGALFDPWLRRIN